MKSKSICRLWLIILVVLCASCSMNRRDVLIQVEVDGKANAIRAEKEGDAVLVTISPGEISSGGRLELVDGTWPEKMILHFESNMLEKIIISNGRIWIEGAVTPSGTKPFRWGESDGSLIRQDRVQGEMPVEVIRSDQAIDIILPPELLKAGRPEINFLWVIAYVE